MAMKRKPFPLPILQTSKTSASIVDRQDTNEMSFEFDHLPIEIAMEIMSCLPVESFMQFKLVDKRSYSLITSLVNDPKFVAKHLEYHSKGNTSAQVYIIVFCRRVEDHEKSTVCETSVSLLTLHRNQGNICHSSEELNLPPFYIDKPKYEPKVSHCDGIVCLVNQCLTVNLCNPALRELKAFRPKSKLDQIPSWNYLIVEAGLGFDSRSEKYKVVRIVRMFFRYDLKAEVYTLGTDSWRDIDLITIPDWQCARLSCPVYFQGCCYWLMLGRMELAHVLSFDMSSEVFRSVTLPDYDRQMALTPRTRLAMWNGSVCLLICYDEMDGFSSFIRKWVMEIERCDGASGYNFTWRECCGIRFSQGIFKTPLTYWKEDELLVSTEDNDQIGSYNVRTKKLQMLHNFHEAYWTLCPKPHVASLVSVKREKRVFAESS